jgi:hypothetical protein
MWFTSTCPPLALGEKIVEEERTSLREQCTHDVKFKGAKQAAPSLRKWVNDTKLSFQKIYHE